MSTLRGLLCLACLLTFAPSCASRPVPVPVVARPVRMQGPQNIVFERPAEPSPVKPYAPKRVADSPRYSWQSPTSATCPARSLDVPDAPDAGTSDSSVGVFPPLSPAEMNALGSPEPLAASAPVDAPERPAADGQDTWGWNGPERQEPPPERRASPDLVVASLRPAFRQCFSRWLDAKADAEGSVYFALELGCAGEVQSILADAKGVDAPTVECLFTVVGPAHFEPPRNGHATIQVPVVFKNASR